MVFEGLEGEGDRCEIGEGSSVLARKPEGMMEEALIMLETE